MEKVHIGQILTDADGVEWRVVSCDDLRVTIERETGGWIEPDLTYEELQQWLER